MEITRGVDVSSYQGKIDWPAVKAAGYDFTYVKASEGTRVMKKFDVNVRRAAAAGLRVGVYHFLRTARWEFGKGWVRDLEYAAEQANTFADAAVWLRDRAQWTNLPPVVDLEWHKGDRGFGVRNRTAFVEAFLEEACQSFCRPCVVYTGRGYSRWKLDVAGSSIGDHALWVAAPRRWTEIVADATRRVFRRQRPKVPKGWDDWWIWQASHRGRVPGVEAKRTDLDVFRGPVGDM